MPALEMSGIVLPIPVHLYEKVGTPPPCTVPTEGRVSDLAVNTAFVLFLGLGDVPGRLCKKL